MAQADYQNVTDEYTRQLRGIFRNLPFTAAEPTRGGQEVPAFELSERLDKFLAASRQFGEANVAYLDAAKPLSEQKDAEEKLLVQAMAEYDVAFTILQQVEEKNLVAGETRLSAAFVKVNKELDELAKLLEKPVGEGILVDNDVKLGFLMKPGNLARAREQLQEKVQESLTTICNQTGKLGWKSVQLFWKINNDFLTEKLLWLGGAALELAEQALGDFSDLVKEVVRKVWDLMKQAFEWLVSLLGKDIAAEVRKQFEKWATNLANKKVEQAVSAAIGEFYDTAKIEQEVESWLEGKTNEAERDSLFAISQKVAKIDDNFSKKIKQIGQFLDIVSRAAGFKFLLSIPNAKPILNGVTALLLGYTILITYDYTGNDRVLKNIFPDRVEGVREIVLA